MTFKDWWARVKDKDWRSLPAESVAQADFTAGWDAALASQQTEIERLREEVHQLLEERRLAR